MMKRFLFFLSFFLLVSGFCHANDGKHDSDIKKAYKKAYKELKSEGWQVYGSSLSLEDALKKYYQKLKEGDDDLRPIITEAEGNNEHTAMKKAQHRANSMYAGQKEAEVTSNANISLSNTNSDNVESHSEFNQTILAKVEQKIKSLQPDLVLIMQKPDGKVRVKMMFLINEDD